MILQTLNLPSDTAIRDEGIGKLTKAIKENYRLIERAVNRNGADSATQQGNWFGSDNMDYSVELSSGSGYLGICDPPEPNTCKIIDGISATNKSAGVVTIGIYIRYSGVDLLIDRAVGVAAGASVFFPETIVLLPTIWSLRSYCSGATVEYTVNYGIRPYGPSPEPYNVSGTCDVNAKLAFIVGTGANVLLNEPLDGQRHLIRTVTLGNGFAGAPTTSLYIREISTANTYDVKVFNVGAYGAGLFSHKNEGMIVLRPDTELVAQHSVDPIAFVASMHYATISVSR